MFFKETLIYPTSQTVQCKFFCIQFNIIGELNYKIVEHTTVIGNLRSFLTCVINE